MKVSYFWVYDTIFYEVFVLDETLMFGWFEGSQFSELEDGLHNEI